MAILHRLNSIRHKDWKPETNTGLAAAQELKAMLDFNAANLADSGINAAINGLLDAGALSEERREARREYLGASLIGDWCLRKIQYSWQCESTFPARTKRIFARGHMFEEITVKALGDVGFRIERGTERTKFSAAEGRFKGHVDGIIVAGPEVAGVGYPCLWEHKALGDSGWKKLEKNGIQKAYEQYYAQCQIYMAYLGLHDHPCLFTAINSNTCEALHLLVPFDAPAAQAASDRAVTVIQATAAGELLDRATDNAADWRCRMCNHKERCWA